MNEGFKSFPRKINECVQEELRVFKGYFKEDNKVLGVFRECFKVAYYRVFKVYQQAGAELGQAQVTQ